MQIAYSLLLDTVARAGYTIVATPYAVTFRHDNCARAVRQQFESAVAELRLSPGGARVAPDGAPVFGLGHSNGSLLHLLIGSFYPQPAASNILISFNNKCAGTGGNGRPAGSLACRHSYHWHSLSGSLPGVHMHTYTGCLTAGA